jgi:hypothetical protein
MSGEIDYALDVRILELKLERYPNTNGIIFINIQNYEPVVFRFQKLPLISQSSGVLAMLSADFEPADVTGPIDVSILLNSSSGNMKILLQIISMLTSFIQASSAILEESKIS